MSSPLVCVRFDDKTSVIDVKGFYEG
jgi:hypothetical protein